jgi:hypothetical protein
MAEDMRQKLRDYFKEDIENLSAFLDKDLSHWK